MFQFEILNASSYRALDSVEDFFNDVVEASWNEQYANGVKVSNGHDAAAYSHFMVIEIFFNSTKISLILDHCGTCALVHLLHLFLYVPMERRLRNAIKRNQATKPTLCFLDSSVRIFRRRFAMGMRHSILRRSLHCWND